MIASARSKVAKMLRRLAKRADPSAATVSVNCDGAFEALAAGMELAYAAGDGDRHVLRNGRPLNYAPPVRWQHRDHVHGAIPPKPDAPDAH